MQAGSNPDKSSFYQENQLEIQLKSVKILPCQPVIDKLFSAGAGE